MLPDVGAPESGVRARNVYGSADNSLQRAILNCGDSHAANVPEFTVRSDDALGDIKSRSFLDDSLD